MEPLSEASRVPLHCFFSLFFVSTLRSLLFVAFLGGGSMQASSNPCVRLKNLQQRSAPHRAVVAVHQSSISPARVQCPAKTTTPKNTMYDSCLLLLRVKRYTSSLPPPPLTPPKIHGLSMEGRLKTASRATAVPISPAASCPVPPPTIPCNASRWSVERASHARTNDYKGSRVLTKCLVVCYVCIKQPIITYINGIPLNRNSSSQSYLLLSFHLLRLW